RMRTQRNHRPRRIGAREAEQLLTGTSTSPDRRDLVRLLAAAAGPARPQELADERTAVAAFVRASRRPPRVRPPRAGPPPPRALPRAVAIKVAVGAALLFLGGAALAAETGTLPDGVQQRVHDFLSGLGVPAPAGSDRSGADEDRTRPTPSATGRPPTTHEPAIVAQCRAFVLSHRKPHPSSVDPAVLRALIAAAGSEANIAAYCAEVLGDHDGQSGQNGDPTI